MSKPNPEDIRIAAASFLPTVCEIRRHIHAHPELSFNEFKTAEYIAAHLDKLGILYQKGIAGTGIVAHIEGRNPKKKCIALRADIDALPIQEENNVPYKSLHAGIMHACGHDAHTACLLGTASILHNLRASFDGTITLLFQPGEEKLPGGASLMLKENALASPKPNYVIGQHVFPQLPAGKVGFKSGMYMASADELYVTVRGKGGHAALPHDYTNPLLIASAILTKLHALFMQNKESIVPDGIPTVLAFGKIEGKGATNIIPDEVHIAGTFRTFNEEWRKEAHAIMKRTAEEIAANMGGACHFQIDVGYPFLVNDEKTTHTARQAAEELLGKENVVDLDMRMTSEDFAFYSQVFPSCFYRLGTGNTERGIVSGLHTPTFDIDEKSLETGVALMAWIALAFLREE